MLTLVQRRKAQMLASEYKEQGGGFRGGKEGPQKNLDRWTKEEWTTEDGSRARKGGKTTRYLPKQAWKSLSAMNFACAPSPMNASTASPTDDACAAILWPTRVM